MACTTVCHRHVKASKDWLMQQGTRKAGVTGALRARTNAVDSHQVQIGKHRLLKSTHHPTKKRCTVVAVAGK